MCTFVNNNKTKKIIPCGYFIKHYVCIVHRRNKLRGFRRFGRRRCGRPRSCLVLYHRFPLLLGRRHGRGGRHGSFGGGRRHDATLRARSGRHEEPTCEAGVRSRSDAGKGQACASAVAVAAPPKRSRMYGGVMGMSVPPSMAGGCSLRARYLSVARTVADAGKKQRAMPFYSAPGVVFSARVIFMPLLELPIRSRARYNSVFSGVRIL